MTEERVIYYLHDGVLCRVFAPDDRILNRRAEGYFGEQGFLPLELTPILWNGEIISEQQFKELYTQQSLAARKKAQ
jgi:hypothetical protein